MDDRSETADSISATTAAIVSEGRALLIAGGMVVTMDPTLGDLPRADVLVRDGAIAAIGSDLSASDAERIDARGTVVMPGLVDTHWHMWNMVARGLPRSVAGGFAATQLALARHWTPELSALGVRLALAEAVASGITTVANWAHNVRSMAHAEAEIAVMRESGLRGRFAHGYPQDLAPDATMDLGGVASLHRGWTSGLISLGIAVRGPDRSAEAVWRREWEAARGMGLPLTTHIATTREAAAKGAIAALAEDGLLGPDIQLVHATHASDADLACVAEAGSPLSLSPWTELAVGFGLPPILRAARAGVRLSLSVDNMLLAGRADMFALMRTTGDLAAGQAETQAALSDRFVLELATVGGAEDLTLGDLIGRLTPGRRADLIAVRIDRLGTRPFGTLDMLLTHMVQPTDVDLVLIDGTIHKRDGRLTRVDIPDLLEQADDAARSVREAAGL